MRRTGLTFCLICLFLTATATMASGDVCCRDWDTSQGTFEFVNSVACLCPIEDVPQIVTVTVWAFEKRLALISIESDCGACTGAGGCFECDEKYCDEQFRDFEIHVQPTDCDEDDLVPDEPYTCDIPPGSGWWCPETSKKECNAECCPHV